MSESTIVLLPPERENLPQTEVLLGEHFELEVELLSRFSNDVTGQARDYFHPMRTAALLNNFAHGKLNAECTSAALLHDVAQAAFLGPDHNPHSYSDLHSKNAARLLQQYSSTEYAREQLPGTTMNRWEYISGLLGDLNTVETYAESNRTIPVGKSPELLEVLGNHSIGEVKKEFWLEPGALTRPADMAGLLSEQGKGANLEAVLVKAAEKLDHLLNPTENERSLLRNVHDAESFYAPLCEIIGQDGLASALRSQAAIIRLQKSGHGAFVDKAAEIVESFGDRQEALTSVEGLLGKLAVGDVDVDHAFLDTTGHGITLGTAELEVHDGSGDTNLPKEARAIWRIKSVGSLAMKLLSDHEDLMGAPLAEQKRVLSQLTAVPADVLGITVVAEDENSLAPLFARSAVVAFDDNDIKLTKSPSRTESYHVSGSVPFTRTILGALALEPTNRDENGEQKVTAKHIDIPEQERVYPVAKFTVEYNGLRTEVQFQTEEARVESRIGLAAHVLYKLKQQLSRANGVHEATIVDLTSNEIVAMQEIHDRAEGLGSYNLVKGDTNRADSFRKRVRTVSQPSKLPWRTQRKWSER